jgi:hypothetical protein
MTHKEVREQREKCVIFLKTHTINEAMIEFNRTYTWVYRLVTEYGATYVPEKKPEVSTYTILKKLLEGKSGSSIARKYGISRQRVSCIKLDAIAGGFTQLRD